MVRTSTAVVASRKKDVPKSTGKKTEKDKKRRTKQERAGLQISVSRCRRMIERKWPGHIANDSSVVLAAFLQFIDTRIITDAAAVATAESQTTRITSAHVQAALTKNAWLGKHLIRGRVLGTAPLTMNLEGEDEEEEQE
jgi:transcriptional regulator of acetoin/glycerol metabolism